MAGSTAATGGATASGVTMPMPWPASVTAAAVARCSACMQLSTRRWPRRAFISIDLAGICSQTTPLAGSSSRTAPVLVSRGSIR